VHALAADGAFKWSYTITGAALGSVALSAGHLAHVATAAGLVYALRPSGTLAWKFRAPVPPTTGIRVSPRGLLLYGARDGLVYALSHSGRLVWTQALDGGLAVGPVISPSGALIAGSSRGTLLIRESAQRRHTALIDAAWAAEPVASPSGDVHVLTDEGLVTVTAKGSRRWALTGVRAVAASPDGLVVATDVELQWVTTSGSVVRRAPLAEPASAPPCVTHGGHVYVPTATGALLLLSPQGALLRRVDVAARALYAPTCVGRGLIGAIVGAEDGSVAAALGP
jgi:outer membrane protein assembly factor BamB